MAPDRVHALFGLLALVVILSPGSCVVPPCHLEVVAADLVAQWPDAQAARDARDVWVDNAVWYWTHGHHSVDGFGVPLIMLEHAPDPSIVWDHLDPVVHPLLASQPNLLFYDQTDGPREEWPLIGFGYTTTYRPCQWPDVCDALVWDVHEAGYHHVPTGDGGMTLATSDDLIDDAASVSVDPDGCEPVWFEDLRVVAGMVRHGRMWVVHVWIDPEGGLPVVARTDPWERWADAPDRVAVDGGSFFEPRAEVCDCKYPDPPDRGC